MVVRAARAEDTRRKPIAKVDAISIIIACAMAVGVVAMVLVTMYLRKEREYTVPAIA